MIMHLRWLTKTWQTSKQSSLAIDHQHESHLSLLLLIDHKIARCRPTGKPRCVPPFLKVDWSGTLFVHQTLLIWRSFYLTDRLFVWYRSVHPSPFALRGVVGSPQPDTLSTRPTTAGDHDIYIMMECVCVCVSVTKNHHFRAERWRHEARRLLGLAGRRLALALCFNFLSNLKNNN